MYLSPLFVRMAVSAEKHEATSSWTVPFWNQFVQNPAEEVFKHIDCE